MQLDDFASLYSIYRSSPAVFRLLHEDGTARRIFQRIMELSVPEQTQVLIRKFTFLRWNVRPAKDLDDFIEKYIKDGTAFVFPHDIPLSVLCDSLAAAATIRYLAHAGMHEMIARCQQLELMQLQNPKLKYIRNAYRTPALRNSEYFPVPKPPRERYQQADAVPVSTIEEQRAIRAIWQLLLVWELHCVVNGQSPRWNWPSNEVSRLQNILLRKYGGMPCGTRSSSQFGPRMNVAVCFRRCNPLGRDSVQLNISRSLQDGSFLVTALLPAPLLFRT